MFKKFLKVSISLIFFYLFISSNVFAFHKYNYKKNHEIYEKSDLTKEEITGKHCALKTKEWKEDNVQVMKDDKLGYKITGYHSTQKIKAEDIWKFEIPLNNNVTEKHLKKLVYLNEDMFLNVENLSKASSKGITLEDFLKIICLQYDEKERPIELDKKSSMYELFIKIAEKNQLLKNDKPNIKAKLSTKIYTEGLIINEPNVVYFIPDYLIAENEEIERAKTKYDDGVKLITKEKDWITDNKQPLLDEIDKKITEFDDQISKVNKDYDNLKINYENFVGDFKNKIIEVEDLLEDIDRSQKDIKEKAKELRSNKREFLNTDILDNLKSKFKSTKKVKGKYYDVYKSLDKLRDTVAGSNKQSRFTDKKKGYLVKWQRLEKSKLNIKQRNNIDELSEEIKKVKSNIINNVDNLIQEIESLEEEFGNKFPWKLIIIGIIVFLIICGVGAYVYLNNRRIKNLQEEADKKVGSLKSDLEDKFKNTTEQIKSATRNAARAQQSMSTSQTESAPIKAKTPEEIISSQYDELVSDYKEALEDFSKVAAFKQKWHGLALSRKERQDGTKTVLVSSSRAFEKAEIWCLTFSEKYFAFPGSSVKSNMAIYMNFDFQKADVDFKGVFAISSGSTYSTEPAVIRRGGAGFVVDRIGKISFPD